MRERREYDESDETAYQRGAPRFEDEEEDVDEDELFNFSESAVVDGDALLDDDAIRPSAKQIAPKTTPKAAPPETEKPPIRKDLPKLIEFSIVARADVGFNGEELFDAFERVGLKYGSVKVFERIDKNRLVDFAVASMGNPGTFPDAGLHNFFCPGIVFFMQPRELDKPLAVFDDFIETIDILAMELDGVVWDHQKQPLTAETIAQFRQILAQKK
jgi:cell division protein ZipA